MPLVTNLGARLADPCVPRKLVMRVLHDGQRELLKKTGMERNLARSM